MQVEVIGLEGIQETLEELEEKTQKTLPLMRELKNHLYNVISESFEKVDCRIGNLEAFTKNDSQRVFESSNIMEYHLLHRHKKQLDILCMHLLQKYFHS